MKPEATRILEFLLARFYWDMSDVYEEALEHHHTKSQAGQSYLRLSGH